MARCLSEIAIINFNKMPAATESNNADIAKKYEYWKPILHWQLKQYDPQIIIFGNTFQHFKEDLRIKDSDKRNYGNSVDYYVRDNKIYLYAYHPSQWTISKEKYVQDIIDVVKLIIGEIKISPYFS
jgi:hypothetical protein